MEPEMVMWILAGFSSLAGTMFAVIFGSFEVFFGVQFFAALLAALGAFFMYSA